MASANFGMIGLGVMGRSLARNIESRGYSVAVYDRHPESVDRFLEEHGAGKKFVGARTLEELVGALERPRRIMMMISAGAPVDEVIGKLAPLLQSGDIPIDGGNSHYLETRRRGAECAARGIHFIGSGVSGGERGALEGPSLMPGGAREAYAAIEPIWKAIAARTEDGPCTAYIGPDGAGHFVKMVHNGIEYGDMQIIAEAYDLLRTVGAMKAEELAETFAKWNEGELESYLIEITGRIFRKIDEETGRPLVDLILDRAGQKGTGRWTIAVALELGVSVPTLAAAVDARIISSMRDERLGAARVFRGRRFRAATDRAKFTEDVRQTLLASKICAYAQGFALMRAASEEYGWSLDLGEIARIWKAGCIIRARFLDRIRAAHRKNAAPTNLLLDREFAKSIRRAQPAWRRVVKTGAGAGIALPAIGASLGYFDGYRRASLPQNLTQAQRDYFGAHTYERVDRPEAGAVHTEWESA